MLMKKLLNIIYNSKKKKLMQHVLMMLLYLNKCLCNDRSEIMMKKKKNCRMIILGDVLTKFLYILIIKLNYASVKKMMAN